MDSEAVKDRAVESSKRPIEELESDKSRKQKLHENVQAKVAADDTTELKRCMEIVPEDDDEVTIKATPLSSKSPTILDYKIYKEGKKKYDVLSPGWEDVPIYKQYTTLNVERCEAPVSAVGIQGYYCLQQKLMLPRSKVTTTDRVSTAGWIKAKWLEEPCRDVHQVGDEREVEVLCTFNWPPSELITKDGVLPERAWSVCSAVQKGWSSRIVKGKVAQPQVNPDLTTVHVEQITPFR
uniref:Reverse transcriptase domain-containing protein n=1 Tax=Tanacetum cinerariifolium TaxID=118510 RepID=A0A699GWQ6_TANCI|nr:hypothetical protein [Tanacetum cinerariifolium]